MRVIVKEPGKPAEERDMENSLEALQAIVGGHIEGIRYNENIVVWCNEEGKLLNLKPNYISTVFGDIVCGTVAATRVDADGDCVDMTPEDCFEIADFLNFFAVENWRIGEEV